MLNVLKTYLVYIGISGLLLVLFNTICTWRLFVKAGVEGFWSLVPVANIFKFLKIANNTPVIQILGILICVVGYFVKGMHKMLFITPIVGLVIFGLGISLMNIKLMERFGYKSFGWILIAVFCPIIGYAVIAFNPYTEYEW